MNRRNFLRAVAAVAVAGCHRTRPEQQTSSRVDTLLDLMNQRLGLMLDVARAKWNAKKQTEDPAREQALLATMAEMGREFGLDSAVTVAFFTAQIEAAKVVQRAAFAEWEAEKRGPFADAPDLSRDLRPKIDRVSRELVAALAKFKQGERVGVEDLRQRAAMMLVGPGVTEQVRAVAIHPLEG